MTREILEEKSLMDLREIAKAQGVKSITKFRKSELIDIIMAGGVVSHKSSQSSDYEEDVQEPTQDAPKSYSQHQSGMYGDSLRPPAVSQMDQHTRPQRQYPMQQQNYQSNYQNRNNYQRDGYQRRDSNYQPFRAIAFDWAKLRRIRH
jgi:transcription termination factor Rho